MNPQLLLRAAWQGVFAPREFYPAQYASIAPQHYRAFYGILLATFAVVATALAMSLRNGVSRTLGLVVCQFAVVLIFFVIGALNRRRTTFIEIFDWTCFAGIAIIPATILADLIRIGGFETLSGLMLLGFSVYLFISGATLRFGFSTVLAWFGVLLPLAASLFVIVVGALITSGKLDLPLTGLGGFDGIEVTTGSPRDRDSIEIRNEDRALESGPEISSEQSATPTP